MSLEREFEKLCNEMTDLKIKHEAFVKMLKYDLKSIVVDDDLYNAIIKLIEELDIKERV